MVSALDMCNQDPTACECLRASIENVCVLTKSSYLFCALSLNLAVYMYALDVNLHQCLSVLVFLLLSDNCLIPQLPASPESHLSSRNYSRRHCTC